MTLGNFQIEVSHIKAHINDNLFFNSETNTLTRSGQDVILGENESRLLHFFIQNPHRSISRDELYDYVWKARGFEVDDSSLTQAISTLRKNLRDSARSPKCIRTEPKIGYRFIADVKVATQPEKDQPEPRLVTTALADKPLDNAESQLLSPLRDEVTPIAAEEAIAAITTPELPTANGRLSRVFFVALISLVIVLSSLILMNVNNSRYVLFYLLDLLR